MSYTYDEIAAALARRKAREAREARELRCKVEGAPRPQPSPYSEAGAYVDPCEAEERAAIQAEAGVVLSDAAPQPSPYSDARNPYLTEDELASLGMLDDPSPARVEVPRASTAADVLEAWRAEGPLVHEPTGIATLDALTDGGPVYGSRWYLLGAPDAGKTALLIQTADRYLARGLAVGLLAVDEEPADVVTRLLQRRGHTRAECETRDPLVLARMAEHAAELERLRLYDSTWTIERAAADLATYAATVGRRAMLGVDSIQTVACAAELAARSTSVREAVTARAVAIRAVATEHRMIVMATSEMARGAYRSTDAAETTDDLAAAKESGAIEYSARVMLALRSVTGEPDLLELRIAKNKHGPRGDRIGLRLNRRLQELTEGEVPEHVDRDTAREHARTGRETNRNRAAALAAVALLAERPGVSTRDLAPELRARLGSCSAPLALAGVALLGPAVVRVPGPRGAIRLYLDGGALPAPIVGDLDGETRASALGCRPPTAGNDHD